MSLSTSRNDAWVPQGVNVMNDCKLCVANVINVCRLWTVWADGVVEVVVEVVVELVVLVVTVSGGGGDGRVGGGGGGGSGPVKCVYVQLRTQPVKHEHMVERMDNTDM